MTQDTRSLHRPDSAVLASADIAVRAPAGLKPAPTRPLQRRLLTTAAASRQNVPIRMPDYAGFRRREGMTTCRGGFQTRPCRGHSVHVVNDLNVAEH